MIENNISNFVETATVWSLDKMTKASTEFCIMKEKENGELFVECNDIIDQIFNNERGKDLVLFVTFSNDETAYRLNMSSLKKSEYLDDETIFCMILEPSEYTESQLKTLVETI